jgi:HEAT repeat protein
MAGARAEPQRPVTESVALTIIALGQFVFFMLLVVLMFANRARTQARVRHETAAAAHAVEPLRHWLIGTGSAIRVGAAFRKLPPDLAREQIILIAARLAPSQLVELTRVLRSESWVVRTVARARSAFWWRRLEAARLLAVVAAPRDRMMVRRLLADKHPAVQTAATNCLAHLDDEGLIADVIERMPERSPGVRLFQAEVLRSVWRLAARPLLQRLQSRAPAARLEAWLSLAEALGEPKCLGAAAALHRHADPRVRVAVIRALRRFPHASTVAALTERINDPEWRVRAEAARSLGAVAGENAIPPLVRAVSDRAWGVRLRAALALAELGRPGRLELAAVIARADDRYARDMAVMVTTLSAGTVAELGAA